MSVKSGASKVGRVRRRVRQDVVFYAPQIGWLLSEQQSFPSGGAETQTLLLASALAARGVRVTIIVFGSPSQVMPTKVDGVRISARAPRETGRGLVGKLVETIRIWASLLSVPSAAIVHRGGASIEVGVIALYARVTRRQLVFASANVADFEYHKLEPNRLYRFVYRLGARLAHAIVVQTEEQIDLCEATFHRRPVLIKSIAPLAEQQAEAPLAFLWVGRLVWYKRPLAYVDLARALPEAKFWMIGVPPHTDGGDQGLFDAVTARAQTLPNLELLTPRPHREIESLMSRAVASVNTADFEGMPNALLEAWSRGVPALVFHHDPGRVITDHGLGHFADGSAAMFASFGRELWATRDNRADLSERCRAYIRTNHQPDLVAARWLTVLSLPSTRRPQTAQQPAPAQPSSV